MDYKKLKGYVEDLERTEKTIPTIVCEVTKACLKEHIEQVKLNIITILKDENIIK